MLREQENVLKTEFGVDELGIVSPKVEYKPVSSVCLFVGGLEPVGFEQVKTYLAKKLDLTVEIIAKAKANGTFRYVFTQSKA
jgi:hypothetical protein